MTRDEDDDKGAEIVSISPQAHVARVCAGLGDEVVRLRAGVDLALRFQRMEFGVENHFEETAERLLAIHGELISFGLTLPPVVRSGAQVVRNALTRADSDELAAVLPAALDATLTWLRSPPEPPSGGNGPLAAQMALRRK